MHDEAEVIDFLSHKDNLAFVLDIAEKVDRVKEKLSRDFWNEVEGTLQAQLTETALHTRSARWTHLFV